MNGSGVYMPHNRAVEYSLDYGRKIIFLCRAHPVSFQPEEGLPDSSACSETKCHIN
jgi:hypothetical protein